MIVMRVTHMDINIQVLICSGSELFSVLSEHRIMDKHHKHGLFFLSGVMMKAISFMKTSKVLLRRARGNRESGVNPERSRHCNGEALFIKSLGHPGKTEKEADDPEPGDLPCMCHRTLRGKEWCTKNQETGEQSVRLAGPLRPCSHRSILYRGRGLSS